MFVPLFADFSQLRRLTSLALKLSITSFWIWDILRIIEAAVACGVRKLVFTSSAGVVFNGGDIIDVDERLPYPDVPLDAYNDSKAKAEALVIASNGKGGLLTVALRPAGIFGYVQSLQT